MLTPCAPALVNPPIHVGLCCDHRQIDNGVALVTACCLVNREALRDCPVESLPYLSGSSSSLLLLYP
jgi:hypothetical protein